MSVTPVRAAPRRAAHLRRTTLGTVLAALLLGALVPAPGVAAETPSVIADPGPSGDFSWKGFNWEKRRYGGGPNYNGKFDAANVGDPDANGHVTLTLSNPTGQAPVGAELISTRRGFGYGTYSTTVEKDLSSLQKEVVWGCLFTYDASVAPGYNEVDLCEASAWGGGTGKQQWPITQGHGYWFDASLPPGAGNDTTVFDVTDHPVLTHRLVWEPRKLTFETFAGKDSSGPLLKRTVLEGGKVPTPARETVHFNLWVTGGGGGDPARVRPEQVVVRDFSFTPAGAVACPLPAPTAVPVPPKPVPVPTAVPVPPKPKPVPAPIKLTSKSSKVRGTITTTLTWSGAKGSTVALVSNGVRRSIENTGSFTTTTRTASVRHQICDSSRCSPVVRGGR